MKSKYTKEELKVIMESHEIQAIPVYHEGIYVGKIYKSLTYEKDRCKYMTEDEYAINLAIDQIDDFVEFKKALNEPLKADVYCYSDCNAKYDVKKQIILEGTMNEVFEKIYKENRNYRYFNGYYHKFADNRLNHLYNLWNHSCCILADLDLMVY